MKKFLTVVLVLLSAGALHADELIATVQTKLARLGYFDGKVDGAWGKGTSNAVSRFQQAKDLRITGDLNPATLNALGIKTAPPPRAPAPVDPAKALVDVFVGGPYLNSPPDFQIQTVQKAQKNLKLLGYYAGPANGAPDAEFTAALKTYQRDNRFRATGRLDKNTLQALGLLYISED